MRSETPHPKRRRGTLAASPLTALLIAGLLAGCGSSAGSGTSAPPASVIPARAQLLASAIVRPSGSLRAAALSAGSALSGRSNPYVSLVALLRTPGSPALSYERDVAPWLGRRAGVFVTSARAAARVGALLERALLSRASSSPAFPFAGSGAEGAIVMDTSDASAARSFLDRQAARAQARESSYRGISYRATSAGIAFALVKRFAVIGSVGDVRAVIDTSLGAPSLRATKSYKRLAGAAPMASLAQLYTAASPGSGSGASSAPTGGAGASALLGLLAGESSATQVSVVPSSSTLTLNADTSGNPAGLAGELFAPGTAATDSLEQLPGESWLAIGLGEGASELGGETRALRELAGLFAPAPGVEATGALSLGSLLGSLLEPLEALAAPTTRARREYASWMGPAALFAGGAGLLELKAALVISSRDAAASRSAVATLAGELRAGGASSATARIAGTEAARTVRLAGLPLSLVIAAGRDAAGQPRFVVGLGEASVAAALRPAGTLAQASSRRAAAALLGEGIEPVAILQVPTLLTLLESIGLTSGPGVSGLLPYLRGLDSVTAGSTQLEGGLKRLRVVLALK